MTPPLIAEPAPAGGSSLDDGINLLYLLTLFVAQWRKFLLAAVLLFALGAAYVYSITPLYEASATLLPQGQEESNNFASIFSNRSPGDIFLGLLASRSVADEVIDRAGLLQEYHTTSRAAARGILAARSVYSVGKDTLVTIKVRDRNAEAAMRITNAYLEGLQSQRDKMLRNQAILHDRFFEAQLSQEADALAEAERQLQAVQEKTGIVQPEAQTNIGLNSIANVRAQITTLQVQLSSLLMGASEQNPQVRALRAQIAQLQAQEHSQEISSATASAGAAASARQMPQLNLDYARKQRQVRYHEAIFTSISNQFEAAKLSEGFTGTPFVVIDQAVVPEGKAYPPRRNLMLLVTAASLLLAFFFVVCVLLWKKLRSDPSQRKYFAAMKASLRHPG